MSHDVHRTIREFIVTPDHEPREDDPYAAEYRAARHHAIDVLDSPCWICGIRKSTGGRMETHHSVIEWSLANGIDPKKLAADFPELDISDEESFRKWLDSEGNLLVLCDVHHRGFPGIHSVTYPPFRAQRYAKDGVELLKDPK